MLTAFAYMIAFAVLGLIALRSVMKMRDRLGILQEILTAYAVIIPCYVILLTQMFSEDARVYVLFVVNAASPKNAHSSHATCCVVFAFLQRIRGWMAVECFADHITQPRDRLVVLLVEFADPLLPRVLQSGGSAAGSHHEVCYDYHAQAVAYGPETCGL